MRLGIIAGNRRYPIIFAKEAKVKGVSLTAVAFKGETSSELKDYVDEIYWIEVGRLEQMIGIFRKCGIKEAVMIGQITPARLFRKIKMDKRAENIFSGLTQLSAETIFGRIASELEAEGIVLKDARLFLNRLLTIYGRINSLEINALEQEDVNFGKDIAKKLAGLNIGQTIVVKNKTVVAVEAFEGTDNTIVRGGRIGRGGIVAVKVSRPGQDMRFDVPVAGPGTIKAMKKAGGGVLALEAGTVLILDKEKTLFLADKYGIKIVGI